MTYQTRWPRSTGAGLRASGKSLQSYMREQLIVMARRRDKAEVMAIVEQALEHDPAPGLSADMIRAGLRELRGE